MSDLCDWLAGVGESMFNTTIKKELINSLVALFDKRGLKHGIDGFDVEFYDKDPRIAKVKEVIDDVIDYKYKELIKDDLEKYLASEEFIDKVVERIMKKQLAT